MSDAATVRVIRDVHDERLRQVNREGWGSRHDDQHDRGELVLAAAAYAAQPKTLYLKHNLDGGFSFVDCWPWAYAYD
ncbi:MAG TPA: hypothetical protein VEC14_02770, partial [Reyranellaceae bacterium]|nr:hypothetical protein [Reyranellaceae bacterium]